MSKSSIIKGTAILTITGLITKILGFYNRIFLTRLIGVSELAIYQLIFPIYILTISFCCQGISTTITKQVSYARGKGNSNQAKTILKYGLSISISLSICISILLNHYCIQISNTILKNNACSELLSISSIAIPFVSTKACINAYFMGYENPAISGFCQLFEQIIRISAAYFLSITYFSHTINAKMAMVAVVIGEISAMFFSIITGLCLRKKYCLTNQINGNKIKNNINISNDCSNLKSFLKDAIPITTNNLMFNLFSSFEAIILPSYLYLFYQDSKQAMDSFGIISGIVIPFLLFPATITTALSTTLLPNISYANAHADKKAIKKALAGSALFCISLGSIAWMIYLIFGIPLCEITFHSNRAGKMLSQIGFLCPFIYLSTTLSSIMHAMDLAFTNLIYNIISILIRICFTIFLVPLYGIPVYFIGMTISYITSVILMVSKLLKTKNLSISNS